MRILGLCMGLLWGCISLATSIEILVPHDIQVKSIPLQIYNVQDFSVLLGLNAFPRQEKQAFFKLYQPPKNIRGIVVVSPGVDNTWIERHVRHFLCMGYAVAVVDSLKMRGQYRFDQISLPEQVMDLGLVIQYLQQQSHFKNLPIGVFGPSRGGMAVNLLLDERIFHTFHLHPIQWACVLNPEIQIAYEENSIQPLKLPHLMIIAQKDDHQSPLLEMDYADVLHSKNPKFKKMMWLDAVEGIDAPYEKHWISNASSMLKAPMVYVNKQGYFFYKKNCFVSWNEVLAFWQPFITKGIHVGHVNDSHQQVMQVIEEFVNVVDGR